MIGENLSSVLAAIGAAAKRARRVSGGVVVVAASKRQPASALREYQEAARSLGIRTVFGESYVQELKLKRAELPAGAEFHVIGALQRNKVRDAVRLADVIESVHSLPILEAVAAAARAEGKRQPIFLQVNISADPAKSGLNPADVAAVVALASHHSDAIRLDGLMAITALYEAPEEARPDFAKMAALRRELEAGGLAEHFDGGRILLSMGMSSDYAIAVEEGADLVRIGTSIFGERQGAPEGPPA